MDIKTEEYNINRRHILMIIINQMIMILAHNSNNNNKINIQRYTKHREQNILLNNNQTNQSQCKEVKHKTSKDCKNKNK